MITKKDYNMLKKYEDYLSSAYHTSTMRSMPHSVQDELYDLYERITGKHMYRNYSCPNCQIKIAKDVAKLFYDYKYMLEDVSV